MAKSDSIMVQFRDGNGMSFDVSGRGCYEDLLKDLIVHEGSTWQVLTTTACLRRSEIRAVYFMEGEKEADDNTPDTPK